MGSVSKRIHFIAMGGSLMHSLAIALHKIGHQVSGSDDQFYDPSKSKLQNNGLLPDVEGWNPDRITAEIDAIILGMHARVDNPELKKAQDLGLRIYSAPEFIYNESQDKQRLVVAGSHGKSSITSMIMHVLAYCNREFDYAVGAQVEGFENMVKLSDAPVIIIEGDEYPSSPLDSTPKILNYHHHIGVISGIAWDHINVFETEEKYVKQFDKFADATPKGGTLVYNEEDGMADVIGGRDREDVHRLEYKTHPSKIIDGQTFLINHDESIPVQIFGSHNMSNISAAKRALEKLSIGADDFYKAIQSFSGASNRLEEIGSNGNITVLKDFAHAPSKVRSATKAVKDRNPDRQLVAIAELHTFSSLNKNFLPEYKDALKSADTKVVFYDPDTIKHKKLPPIDSADIKSAFGSEDLMVFDNPADFSSWLESNHWNNTNLLFMSSGTFGGLDFEKLTQNILAE